jgi:SAM-dependent methyltransferase
MDFDENFEAVRAYFGQKFKTYGATPQGVDWKSTQVHELRMKQLTRIFNQPAGFTILDYGCGYGAFADYLDANGYHYDQFFGLDIVETMIQKGRELHPDTQRFKFSTRLVDLPVADYAIACGVFNNKLEASYQDWSQHVLSSLNEMNEHCKYGFTSNFLTQYSESERMRSDLYYADPCFLFDYCKTHFSRNVALLHDYELYDFTLLIRKN